MRTEILNRRQVGTPEREPVEKSPEFRAMSVVVDDSEALARLVKGADAERKRLDAFRQQAATPEARRRALAAFD